MTETRFLPVLGLIVFVSLVAFIGSPAWAVDFSVSPSGETDVTTLPDDMCVWVHPTDRSQSVILGTRKSASPNGGLYAWGVSGGASTWNNISSYGKKTNNVDVRYNFQAGAETWDLVAVSNRTDQTIDLFKVDTDGSGLFNGLTLVGSLDPTTLGSDHPYGLAMFHYKSENKHYVIASDYDGRVEQMLLTYHSDGGAGNYVQGTSVWNADVNGAADTREVEGIVADDETGYVYMAAEDTSLWRYTTSSGTIQSTGRVEVDNVSGANLTADVEGLTIWYSSTDGEGYLIASSQGNSEFAIYDRNFSGTDANAHLYNFNTTDGAGSLDAVSSTDGIDVVNLDLGGDYDAGMFLAHDDANNPSGENFKMFAWEDIAKGPASDLRYIGDGTETGWDPRSVAEPVIVQADCDNDEDVDQSDFGQLQSCYGETITPGHCECADLDGNGVVTAVDDLPIFLGCISGADIPADPNCAD